MLMNKTAVQCWNIVKYEIGSIIDKFVPLKKQGKRSRKKHLNVIITSSTLTRTAANIEVIYYEVHIHVLYIYYLSLKCLRVNSGVALFVE